MAQDWNNPALPWNDTNLPWKNTALPWNDPNLPWKAGSASQPVATDKMLLEDGTDHLLLETGDFLLFE
jgi:hypothetical protein